MKVGDTVEVGDEANVLCLNRKALALYPSGDLALITYSFFSDATSQVVFSPEEMEAMKAWLNKKES